MRQDSHTRQTLGILRQKRNTSLRLGALARQGVRLGAKAMKSGRRASSHSPRVKVAAGEGAKREAKSKSAPAPPRDFVGYGRNPPHARWPGDARIAVNFNLNVEAGGEHSILEGDASSENILTDIGYASYEGARSPLVESAFEYGPRVGCWRLLRIFKTFNIKISVLGVVRGLQHYPDLVRAFVDEGHEIVSHGWRWIDYTKMSEKEEREHIRLATEGIVELTGQKPVGWFGGRPSANTRRLLVEQGNYLYDRDYLGDELPFWVETLGRPHLIVPYSLETNDNRFDQNNGFSTADEFARYMIDCFDLMYEEGAERPKIMSIALHDRLIGRPARALGLIKFLDHAKKHDRVWFCTGRDIAEHWRREHPQAA
jgi:peptidoglycan/xylan/chitin deacetylase (PgdA/CDA1 family)